MTKRKDAIEISQNQIKSKKELTSGEQLQADSIYEKLGRIDLDVVEKELKELVVQIEATNTRLEKSKAVTHDTLKLVVSL
jgi:hypothetical protein